MLNRILYPAITLCVALFFSLYIDALTFFQWNTLFTVVGGLCTAATFALSLDAWLLKEREMSAVQEKQFKIVVWVTSVGFLLVFGYFLSHHSKKQVMEELDKNGVYAEGKLMTGRSDHSLSANDKFILVKFFDDEKKKQEARLYVNDSTFNSFLKGQKIPLIHLPGHPDVVRMLVTDEELTKYSGFNNRPLTMTDMMKMVDLKPGKEIQNYLNAVNLQWRILPGYYENNYRYFNELKLLLVTSNEGVIKYLHNDFNPKLFNNELKRYRFKPTMVMGEKAYVNEEFVFSVKSEEIPLVPKDYDDIDDSDSGRDPYTKKVSAFAIARKSTLGL